MALAECQRQLDTQMMAGAAEQHVSAQFTLGWCYLGDSFGVDTLVRYIIGVDP
ncbi:hypothetical protein BN2476_990050 [Paraburkholderia piptadeniae]|uniref:Uncharacterized protein n=1 Tax=Paraburkholderia piptadeniae TaxID=1701573 RepID=A0A1N7SUK8_9BURK|nr:hypothetical protein BN2476_990050 [Paraburkholderia piptadeniae]